MPSRLVLRFDGVFFQPAAKAPDALLTGLNVAVDGALQDKSQSPQPIACLTRFEGNLAFFPQEFDHHHTIPALAWQPKFFLGLAKFIELLKDRIDSFQGRIRMLAILFPIAVHTSDIAFLGDVQMKAMLPHEIPPGRFTSDPTPVEPVLVRERKRLLVPRTKKAGQGRVRHRASRGLFLLRNQEP
jgi:hypothetical protein